MRPVLRPQRPHLAHHPYNEDAYSITYSLLNVHSRRPLIDWHLSRVFLPLFAAGLIMPKYIAFGLTLILIVDALQIQAGDNRTIKLYDGRRFYFSIIPLHNSG